MFEVAIVCLSALIGLVLTLQHLKTVQANKQAFQDETKEVAMKAVEERLKVTPDFYKDLEVVNANQLRLVQELDLLKKTQQLRTTFSGRPPGSIV